MMKLAIAVVALMTAGGCGGGCSDGQYRCSGSNLEACQQGAWKLHADCKQGMPWADCYSCSNGTATCAGSKTAACQ